MNEGVYDIIVKPIEIDELQECINKLTKLRKQSIKLSKPSQTVLAQQIKKLSDDPTSLKVDPNLTYKVARQLPVGQQVGVIHRLIDGFNLEELTDLKCRVEAQEYIEAERQEEREELAIKVYEELGFDQNKLPLVALEQGRLEERFVKATAASGEIKDYGIHLYLRWKVTDTDQAYYLGSAHSLNERTKTLLSLIGHSLKRNQAEKSAQLDEEEIKSPRQEPEKRQVKAPINVRNKKFETR